MNTFTTDAINIKTYPLSENDNIVVMFSRDKGLIKGVAATTWQMFLPDPALA